MKGAKKVCTWHNKGTNKSLFLYNVICVVIIVLVFFCVRANFFFYFLLVCLCVEERESGSDWVTAYGLWVCTTTLIMLWRRNDKKNKVQKKSDKVTRPWLYPWHRVVQSAYVLHTTHRPEKETWDKKKVIDDMKGQKMNMKEKFFFMFSSLLSGACINLQKCSSIIFQTRKYGEDNI